MILGQYLKFLKFVFSLNGPRFSDDLISVTRPQDYLPRIRILLTVILDFSKRVSL